MHFSADNTVLHAQRKNCQVQHKYPCGRSEFTAVQMSAGKCKRAPEVPLGATSGSSSGSDDDSPRCVPCAAPSSSTLLQHHQQSHQLKSSRSVSAATGSVTTLINSNSLTPADDGSSSAAVPVSSIAAASVSDVDYDYYDAASSPSGSSTLSGPIYIRQPGFSEHAHSRVAPPSAAGQQSAHRPRVKKKKNSTRGDSQQLSSGLDIDFEGFSAAVVVLPTSTAGPSSSGLDVGLERIGVSTSIDGAQLQQLSQQELASSRHPPLRQPVNVSCRSRTHRGMQIQNNCYKS